MSLLKVLPHWGIFAAVTAFFGLFFLLCMRGYSYIAYALFLLSAMTVAYNIAPRWLWVTALLLVCVGLIYFCVLELSIVRNARTDADGSEDYVIVLGCEVRGETPSLSLVNRLEAAREYLDANPDAVAIVTGGQGEGEDITEAECMFSYLVARGIDPSHIIMEHDATSTMENLSYSFDIIRSLGAEPDGNTAIISSPYHLYRAKSMARLQGVSATGIASRPGYPLMMLNFYIREAFGVTHLWVFGC